METCLSNDQRQPDGKRQLRYRALHFINVANRVDAANPSVKQNFRLCEIMNMKIHLSVLSGRVTGVLH